MGNCICADQKSYEEQRIRDDEQKIRDDEQKIRDGELRIIHKSLEESIKGMRESHDRISHTLNSITPEEKKEMAR